jgi:biotin operon repressor
MDKMLSESMLPFFTDPYPNELLYSAFARYHFYSGNVSLTNTLMDLFGKRTIYPSFEIGTNLRLFCNRIGNSYSPEYLIQEHTLFPFYQPFLPSERSVEILKSIANGNKNGIQMKIGITPGSICKKEDIYYCLSCASEDMEKLGETYIHREHQLQGVMVCPHHGRLLKKYPIKKGEKSSLEYVRVDESLLDLSDTYLQQEKYQESLFQISKAAYYLLTHDLSCFSRSEVQFRYKNLLYEMKLTGCNLQVKQEELYGMLINHYGTELLDLLESNLDKNDKSNWLRNATCSRKRTVHPLRHILLILFLIGDMDAFFKGIGQTYNPFGKGPWPCLNKASDHYRQDVIDYVTITTNSHKVGKPVGTFICTCGYIYSRSGPDKMENDRYRKDRIKDFGYVWKNKLKKLLNEGCHSYYKMAIQLGCSRLTIRKFVAIFKEKGFVSIKNLSNQKMPESPLNEKYRSRLLCIIKENPELTRTDIEAKCTKEYSYLYRHEKDWLFEVLPAKIAPKGVIVSYDWNKRDLEILGKLQYAHTEMLNRVKPIRITKLSLGKAISNLSLLVKKLHKLPCCMDYIEKVSETMLDFKLRRCRIVVLQMQKEGVPLTPWRIKKRAYLTNEEYEWIKEKLE